MLLAQEGSQVPPPFFPHTGKAVWLSRAPSLMTSSVQRLAGCTALHIWNDWSIHPRVQGT